MRSLRSHIFCIIVVMKHSFYQHRDTKWLLGNSPASARIVGAIVALVLIAPFVLATFLEREYGDSVTIVVLLGIVLAAIIGIVWLTRIRFALIPVALVALIIGSVISILVTVFMQW